MFKLIKKGRTNKLQKKKNAQSTYYSVKDVCFAMLLKTGLFDNTTFTKA